MCCVKYLTVTFPAKIDKPVPASQAQFQQFRVTKRLCVEGSNSVVIVDTSVMIQNFLLTVLLERPHRHFRLSSNLIVLFHFFLTTVGEVPHKRINLGPRIS